MNNGDFSHISQYTMKFDLLILKDNLVHNLLSNNELTAFLIKSE